MAGGVCATGGDGDLASLGGYSEKSTRRCVWNVWFVSGLSLSESDAMSD